MERLRLCSEAARPPQCLELVRHGADEDEAGARYMPVHPTLAAMLAEWRLKGWVEMIGRVAKPEDLIVPMPEGPRVELGSMRSKNDSYKRLCSDLVTLGLRHRRGHDLRRTMISLTRTDGARKDLLELCTHTPRKQSTIDVYTEFPWESLCTEVAKLKIRREVRGEVIRLRREPSMLTSRPPRTTGRSRARWPQKPQ